ncbi:MAG: T9SS type A sorting domain-containing protein [Candidatus Kapabacteria bacterium]|nr:T9SS type A sorting domain-containing protein [Candidatus Kapabacteria bacterium]
MQKLIKKLLILTVFTVGLIMSTNALMAQLPILTFPNNGSSCLDKSQIYTWAPVNGASWYNITVAEDASFTVVDFAVTHLTSTSFSAVMPKYGVTYYWKVAAYYTETQYITSDVWTYAVKGAPPLLSLPANNDNCVKVKPTFSWSAVQGATNYAIQVSTTSTFTPLVLNIGNIASTTYSASLPAEWTTYYYRVSASFTTCTSDWSAVNSFTTGNFAPLLNSPANQAQAVPFAANFSWTNKSADQNVGNYHIQVATDPTFSGTFTNDSWIPTNQFSTVLPSIYNQTYYWRTSASFTSCISDWSSVNNFKTPYQTPPLVSPSDSAKCFPLSGTLKWNKVPMATKYSIQISQYENFSSLSYYTNNITDTTFTPSPALTPTTVYYWRVCALDLTNSSTWSTARIFTSTIRPSSTGVPKDSAVGLSLNNTFSWEGFSAGTTYNFQISRTSNFADTLVNAVNLTSNTFNYTFPSYYTRYYWRVNAQFGQCQSVFSKIYTLKTTLPAPILTTPSNTSTQQMPIVYLNWNLVPFATSYNIQVASDKNFNNIVDGMTGDITSQFGATRLNQNTIYYWHVSAVNSDGDSPWSTVWSFKTGFNGPEIVSLKSPEDNAIKIKLDSSLNWNSAKYAKYYHIQLSDVNTFATKLIDTNNVIPTTLKLKGLTNFKTYYWRVQSVSDSGATVWSDVWSFRSIAAIPTDTTKLWTPNDNLTNMDYFVKFTWYQAANCDGYQLQIAKTNAFDQASMFDDVKAIYALNYTSFNLAFSTDYYWKVRGFNEAGPGPWSVIRKFKTGITSVKDAELDYFSISISPNPVSDKFELSYTLTESAPLTIQLFDVSGNMVQSTNKFIFAPGAYKDIVSLNGLSNGVYYVILSDGNHSGIHQISIIK